MHSIKQHLDLIRSLESTTLLQEGETGAKIGGALGSLIGQRDAGARMGSSIGDFFHSTSKGHTTGSAEKSSSGASGSDSSFGSSSSGGYMTVGPDGKTMVGVTDAPDGTQTGQDHPDKPKTRSNGTREDKYGNTPADYVPQPTISVHANSSLKSGGSFADEIQKLESARGTGLKLSQSFSFKSSTLALLEGERADEANQRVWTNLASLGSFNMGDEVAQFYKKYGYKLTSDKDSVTPSKFGIFRTEEQQVSKGFRDIIIRNNFILFAFESPKGKGLHIIQVSFTGPRSDYQNGGLEALNSLCNNLEPAANIKAIQTK
jgi:hypothetical protein